MLDNNVPDMRVNIVLELHLARALQEHLGSKMDQLFQKHDIGKDMSHDQVLQVTSVKLISFAQLLHYYPVNQQGKFMGKLKPVSQKAIQPIHIICPSSVECETMTCNPRSLLQASKPRDIPRVTLIKNFTIHADVPVLTGKCSVFQTLYYVDHEQTPVPEEANQWNKVYLNSAKYFKVGQNPWVDWLFSNGVLSRMYSFHASAAALTEFWNTTFWKTQDIQTRKLSCCQVWQAFVQESVRTIAARSNLNLELQDGLPIEEVTKQAFGEYAELAVQDATEARERAQN